MFYKKYEEKGKIQRTNIPWQLAKLLMMQNISPWLSKTDKEMIKNWMGKISPVFSGNRLLLDDLWAQGEASTHFFSTEKKKNIVLLALWLDKVLGPESNKKYPWSKLHVFRRKQRTRLEAPKYFHWGY